VPRFVRRDWLASEVGERLTDPSCRMAPCWRAWFPVVELVLVYTTRARFRHVSAPRSWRLWRQWTWALRRRRLPGRCLVPSSLPCRGAARLAAGSAGDRGRHTPIRLVMVNMP